MTRLSEHFTTEELACRCCGACHVQTSLIDLLELMRSLAGGEPLVVNSCYRCPSHNAEVGGAPNSSHLRGLACDLHVPDGVRMHRLVRAAFGAGAMGIELGADYLHVDVDQSLPRPCCWINPAHCREVAADQ